MFVGITNIPRDYAWGSVTAIAELLGSRPSGGPEAELWLGTHPGSPSRLVGAEGTLRDVVGGELPFLLKVLAADSPVSLQVHPDAAQAEKGFVRENNEGIPLDAPYRNYRDRFPKPEMIYALSDPFLALAGFRAVEEIRKQLIPVAENATISGLLIRLVDDASIKETFRWLITRGDGVDALIATFSSQTWIGVEWDFVRILAHAYPGDPGIVISFLLNSVTLLPGEAMFVGARIIHTYLRGLGIELMTGSDNVLRGGLTPKHVDVAELMRVIDFTPRAPVIYRSLPGAAPVERLEPEGAGFALARVSGDGELNLSGDAVVLCSRGNFRIDGVLSRIELSRGQSSYVSADEERLEFVGSGELFVATAT